MGGFTESELEEQVLAWFRDLGYEVLLGASLAPGDEVPDSRWLNQVLLPQRLEESMARLNPDVPADAREEALRKLQQAEHPSLYENN